MPVWMRNDPADLLPFYTSQSEIRLAQLFQHAQQVVEDPKLDPGAAWYEARNLMRQGLRREACDAVVPAAVCRLDAARCSP